MLPEYFGLIEGHRSLQLALMTQTVKDMHLSGPIPWYMLGLATYKIHSFPKITSTPTLNK